MFFGQKRSGHHAIIDWIFKNKSYCHYNNCNLKKSESIIGSGDIVVASFEGAIPNYDWKSNQSVKCLVLRNPYNMYASRLELKIRTKDDDWDSCLEPKKWIDHAKEFIGDTCLLGSSINICYDRWFADIKYRKHLSNLFAVESSDLLASVSSFGGGSSFDGLSYNGRAHEMDVLNRWRKFKNHEEFMSIMNNLEIKELWHQIVGS